MDKPILTAERLREVLRYDPETGVLTWLVSRRGDTKAGDVAGCDGGNGYRQIRIDGIAYKAHRLAWFYVTGKWPPDQIDHRNGARSDNRWVNLREATVAQNQQNRTKRADNTSGHMGVSWHKRDAKWQAQITSQGRHHHLGFFDALEEAVTAHAEAKAKLHTFQPTVREEQTLW